jgi:hypothetical protein
MRQPEPRSFATQRRTLPTLPLDRVTDVRTILPGAKRGADRGLAKHTIICIGYTFLNDPIDGLTTDRDTPRDLAIRSRCAIRSSPRYMIARLLMRA